MTVATSSPATQVLRSPLRRAERWLAGWGVPIFVILAWEAAGQWGALPRYLVAPSTILRTGTAMAMDGELIGHIGSSLFRQSLGFVCGATSGTLIGLLAGLFKPVARFYEPLVSLIYPVPKVAILPLIFVWFGLGDLSKIVVMTLSIFFPCYIAAYQGAISVRQIHVWSAQNFGASRSKILRGVILPSALPDIFNGLRIGLALSFVLMVTTEFVVSTKGLGYIIARAEENARFDRMYVAIVTIGVLGFCADRLLLAVRRRLLIGQMLGKDQGHG